MSLLARFAKDKSGNVFMLFGLALVPIIGLTGAAIDYSRATTARTSLNAAIDSAALMAARDAASLTDGELKTRIDGWIKANLNSDALASFSGATVAIDRTNRTISISGSSDVATTLTKVIGKDTIKVASSSQSTWGTNIIELAMVLDNTGSMASSGKMTALKAASLNLIDIMKAASYEQDQIRISIVPFATQVKLSTDYKDAAWLRYTQTRTTGSGKSQKTETIAKSTWTGCITDRDQPYDTQDGGSLVASETWYPADFCANTSLVQIQPLTSNWDTLKATINAMTPTGNTNVTIGATWGMATLSTAAPFVEAKPTTTPRLKKFMILLTDGDNTQNRFSTTQSAIDARTAMACTNIKATGVTVYTIRVIDGNATLLKNCATNSGMYYEVTTASQLTPIFQAIAKEISAVRLTM